MAACGCGAGHQGKVGEVMKDFLQSLAFCIIVAVLVWAYCKITPDQCSAECDWAREQLEKICR